MWVVLTRPSCGGRRRLTVFGWGNAFPFRECPLHGSMAAVPGPRHKKPAVAYSHRDNQKDKMPLCTSAQEPLPCPQWLIQTQVLLAPAKCPQITENLPNHAQTFPWETTDSDSLTNVQGRPLRGPMATPAFVWWIQLRPRCCVNGDAQLPKETRVPGERGAGLSRSQCRTWEFLAGWLESGGFPK